MLQYLFLFQWDRHGNYVQTEQDKVTEVASKEELDARLSSCIIYTNEFMRVHNAKRTLTFQWLEEKEREEWDEDYSSAQQSIVYLSYELHCN